MDLPLRGPHQGYRFAGVLPLVLGPVFRFRPSFSIQGLFFRVENFEINKYERASIFGGGCSTRLVLKEPAADVGGVAFVEFMVFEAVQYVEVKHR